MMDIADTMKAAAKLMDETRQEYLFDERYDCMEECDPITSQHYLIALSHLELAQYNFTLAAIHAEKNDANR